MGQLSINAMVPPPRSDRRATSAHPPVYNVPSMAKWQEERDKRRAAAPLWRRLLGRV